MQEINATITPSAGVLPVVAIVGRPNVGKSALFNRLVGGRVALVEDLPGTTRDRLYGTVDWPRRPFRLIDTGGLEDASGGGYPALIRLQIDRAISEAVAILFVVDARDGITAADTEAAELLRRESGRFRDPCGARMERRPCQADRWRTPSRVDEICRHVLDASR